MWSHDRVDPVDRLYKVGLKIELSSLGRGRAEKEGREKREKGDKEKRGKREKEKRERKREKRKELRRARGVWR